MESKFNFYDFVGYVIPGAFIAGIIYWTLADFSIFIKFGALGTLGGSIVFLIISYLLGHILAALAKHFAGRAEKKARKKLEEKQTKLKAQFDKLTQERKDTDGVSAELKQLSKQTDLNKPFDWRAGYSFVDYRYSTELLKNTTVGTANPMYSKDPRTDYTDDFKSKLKDAFNAVWTIDIGNPADNKAVQKAFDLSYAFVVSKNLNPHIELFNAFYGFYRNLLTALWMGIFFISIIFLHNLFLAIFFEAWNNDPTVLEKKIIPNLILSALSVFVLLYLGMPVRKRQEDYGKAFATTVYASFLAWYYSTKYTKAQGGAGEQSGGAGGG